MLAKILDDGRSRPDEDGNVDGDGQVSGVGYEDGDKYGMLVTMGR